MKQILFAIFVSLLIIPSCRKNNTGTDGITGSWKLIQVYDKSTATTNFPPAGSTTDIVLTFLNTNKFAGHTLVNILTDGSFTLNGNKINFGIFSMTKVGEDPWGESFLTVLNACLLQSTTPCNPSTMSIQGKLMKITTALRYDITLEKI